MHCYQCTLVCSAKLHVMCTGASAMEMKTETNSDDVMECLFAHYRTSAELQHGNTTSSLSEFIDSPSSSSSEFISSHSYFCWYCWKIICLSPETSVNGLHFCPWYMDLSSFIFLSWASKDTSFLEQNAYRPFKVIQDHWFWHQSKGRMRLPISH